MGSGIGSKLLTLAMLTTASGLAAAEPMTVELRLGARAGLDPASVALAQRTASALLSASGIDAEWPDCRVAESCEGNRAAAVFVQLLPVSKLTEPGVCGEATRDARSNVPTVLVYLPRHLELTHSMRSHSRMNPALATLDAGHLVGLTIAHEVGHALGLSHAASGVMKARPSLDDVIALRASWLVFKPQEGARMRLTIAARQKALVASAVGPAIAGSVSGPSH